MSNPYLHPQRIRGALRTLDLRPSRGMGQNFLLDADALATIVTAAELAPTDLVVEVGPGLGVLTWELTRQAAHTIAIELDRRLAARLTEEFAGQPLTIVQADVLQVRPGDLLPADTHTSGYKLVANLPYAITSAVLRHFLEADLSPTLSVVLVQWEVAQRITAGPGDLSILAHSVQLYAEPTIIARVPASSFLPAPAVDSAVLRLRRRQQLAVAVDDVDRLFRVIKAGFLHGRKQLGNALPSGLAAMGFDVPRATALVALAAAGIDPQRRAETLTLAEWARLDAEIW
ncbi:16S rRNA (adenine(1518)-N(6)/adenine(1519)-N(6))-dimethyltransferase RsmA [Candidatus Chloroploca asiatica]|uniref:Ribosomal RNA small subunit methyltransferase A n=1 Tax=Candidatus Chloroploca asiatica TaxID=1506545 RepID=A0A2H3L6I6_9CHLR|nr:16S rRNA (adenine(1518)-N(6)/adenine(1519)-N(6))-dimethyltransferase RsmA [Candidatus Chloroploca asiatica]PDV98843.1 16S rRNA (adenine(1518)-N(6)/adenine(1519)-N(6))-dimethyltransferase [Candidatus Chloroploca asiatica]